MIRINPKNKKGIIITYVLVFGAAFLLLLAGLLSFILFQLRMSNQKVSWNLALDVAEAGVDYYRWCLNNGIEQNCQPQKDYLDSLGNKIGTFSLETTSTISCGQTIQRKITSTGWTKDFPNTKRKISVLYARTSIAEYSYILNDNVWVGSDYQINGPYHSNGGVRMDGENQSIVSSAQNEWVCTSKSFGCSPCPTQNGCRVQKKRCICPGVFTTTSNSGSGLFSFPVPSFDFSKIMINLAQMKSVALASGGVYLYPSVTLDRGGKGYHLKFKNDGTFEVWIITGLSKTYGYGRRGHGRYYDWHDDDFTISREYLYETYDIPSSCSAIFVEDNLWVEGVIKGKVAVASANLINHNKDTNIILSGNIDYSTEDGSDGLTLIAERNILIGPNSPEVMILRGIFIAQKGIFGRNNYPNNLRDDLQIYGSVISGGKTITRWTSGSQLISGYRTIENYFDANLVYNPPPFVPYLNPEFKIVDWEEK